MRRTITLCLGLAFLLAQSIASAHVHLLGWSHARPSVTADHHAPDLDRDCPICVGLHAAGKLLLPGGPMAPRVLDAGIAAPPFSVQPDSPAPPTAFRPRAPPQV